MSFCRISEVSDFCLARVHAGPSPSEVVFECRDRKSKHKVRFQTVDELLVHALAHKSEGKKVPTEALERIKDWARKEAELKTQEMVRSVALGKSRAKEWEEEEARGK